ncbi:MAG: VTT domain-containing protein [Planctomycetota bacterium]
MSETSETTTAEQPQTGRQVAALLREVGPVVGALIILSLTLPGILGTFVLLGSVIGPERLRSWVDSLGPYAAFICAGLFALTTGSAMLPTYALSFACGAIFGTMFEGGWIAMFGVVVGALIGYGWGALLARQRIMSVIDRHEKARIVRSALLDRPFLTELMIVTLIRVPPNSPFAMTNLAMSSTRVGLPAYIIGTAIGIAPRTLFAVWLGVSTVDLTEAQSAGGRMRVFIGIAIGVAIFLLLYRLFSKWAREALDRHLDEHPEWARSSDRTP